MGGAVIDHSLQRVCDYKSGRGFNNLSSFVRYVRLLDNVRIDSPASVSEDRISRRDLQRSNFRGPQRERRIGNWTRQAECKCGVRNARQSRLHGDLHRHHVE